MTRPQIAPPKLYVTRELLVAAGGENVTGIVPEQPSIKTIIERSSRGELRGLAVARLILHTSDSTGDEALRVFRLASYHPEATTLDVTERPDVHPHELIAEGLPEVHTLVVPIKEFDPSSAAWGLYGAAEKYGRALGPAPQEPRVPAIGNPFGSLAQALAGLTGIAVSRLQPEERRQTPSELAEQALAGLFPIAEAGDSALRSAFSLPEQLPLQPMSPDGMALLVEQAPPFAFKYAPQ